MKRAALLLTIPLMAVAAEPVDRWTGFRGTGDSLSESSAPVSWSLKENLVWAVDLPGSGQSTPVVWNRKVFLTSVDGANKERLLVHCWSLDTGQMLWKREFPSSRPQAAGERVSRAASTPALDARGVYALFDSGDIFAIDHSGELLWKLDLNNAYGPIQNGHDFGSSPRQNADSLFIHVNHLGPSYVVALDKRTGKARWKTDLSPEGGWNTPVLAGNLLLVSRLGGATGLDVSTGKLRWEHKETWSQATAIPSISVADGKAIVPSMIKGGSFALRLDSTPAVAWRPAKASTQYSSPLIHDGRVYWVNGVGALFCTDLKTGEDLWAHRLPGSVWASPVAAGGRLYFTTGEGVTVVMEPGPKPNVIATNSLPVNGSVYGVAVAEGGLLLRTLTQMWRVAPHDSAPVIRTRLETTPAPKRLPPVPLETEKIFRDPGSKAGESRPHPKTGSPYAWSPAGRFLMGCSEGDAQCAPDEKPSREVHLTRGYWIAATETTTSDYLRFAKSTGRPLPAEPKLQRTPLNPGHANDKLPITNVTWDDAVQFCRWTGGRLPTEAEWEHAARASSSASRYGALDEIAWYGDNSGRERIDTTAIVASEREKYLLRQAENGNTMHPVATKKPNAWGLHDMLGNVWEWTSDYYHPYPAEPASNPKATEESDRMAARGGSWQFFPARITHSVRMRYRPDTSNESLGFRCVQDIP